MLNLFALSLLFPMSVEFTNLVIMYGAQYTFDGNIL